MMTTSDPAAPAYTVDRHKDGRRWAVVDTGGHYPATRLLCVYERRGDADNLAAHMNGAKAARDGVPVSDT